MATIHVPIEITVEGDQISHIDLYEIEFTAIDGLPPAKSKLAFVDVAAMFTKIGESSTANTGFAFKDEPIRYEAQDQNQDYEDPEFEKEIRFHEPDDEDENLNQDQDDEDPHTTTKKIIPKQDTRPKPYSKTRTLRHYAKPGKSTSSSSRYTRKIIDIPQSILDGLHRPS